MLKEKKNLEIDTPSIYLFHISELSFTSSEIRGSEF